MSEEIGANCRHLPFYGQPPRYPGGVTVSTGKVDVMAGHGSCVPPGFCRAALRARFLGWRRRGQQLFLTR
jgi:hypothetical protein